MELRVFQKLVIRYCVLACLEWAAMLVAIQLRVQVLPFGAPLGNGYRPFPIGAIGLLLAATFVAVVLEWRLARHSKQRSQLAPVWPLLVAATLTAGGIYLLLPDFSQLQLLYFLISIIFVGWLFIALPRTFLRSKTEFDLGRELRRLWDYRHLLRLWLRYTIQARYTQTTLGIIWIILLPLSTALVLSIAFSQFLRIGRFAGDVPFLTFFLAGIVPYGIFNSGVSKSTSAISGQIGIISRVYFPREILVLLPMGEALVDFVFTFLVLIAINGLYGNWPEPRYFLLLVPLLILILLSLGVMFVISTWSMIVRDVPQLVGVVLQLLFYVTPIIYPFESIPPNFRFLVLLNPLTPLVQSFRQIVIYKQGLDLISLYYPLVVSSGLLLAAFAFFKSREGVLSDLV